MRVGSPAVAALCVLCLLALLELVPANNNPFYTNSRYGKRAPGPGSGVARIWSNTRRSGNVEPRADKFFLNSRYGKRASAPVLLQQQVEPDGPLISAVVADAEDSSVEAAASLACQYTGVHDLFRCFTRKESGHSSSGPGNTSEESQNNN